MTTEQTAQQLELAAQILRTGHPWGYRHIAGSHHKYNTPIEVVADGNFLSPLLATPPDNRPLHNPDNLTAEQVGVGYRLTVEGESVPRLGAEWWCRSSSAWLTSTGAYLPQHNTVRVPLKTPWPEPAFQLPPPPPGVRWHREDGWKADDLPSGYRPLVAGETLVRDEPFRYDSGLKDWVKGIAGQRPENNPACFFTTTRPLVFNHAGKTWTWHRPGDPMPCDGERMVHILTRDNDFSEEPCKAEDYEWNQIEGSGRFAEIIGWRYAEPQTKTVPLGREDVTPLTRLRVKVRGENHTAWITPLSAAEDGVVIATPRQVVKVSWESLLADYERNESLATGRWNPDAWEPCSKTIPA